MQDHFYKFPDQSSMLTALEPLSMTYTDEDGVIHASQGGHQWALWTVGEINGIEGYHLNVRVVDPDFDISALAEFEVQPKNPRCVWA